MIYDGVQSLTTQFGDGDEYIQQNHDFSPTDVVRGAQIVILPQHLATVIDLSDLTRVVNIKWMHDVDTTL